MALRASFNPSPKHKKACFATNFLPTRSRKKSEVSTFLEIGHVWVLALSFSFQANDSFPTCPLIVTPLLFLLCFFRTLTQDEVRVSRLFVSFRDKITLYFEQNATFFITHTIFDTEYWLRFSLHFLPW